jgi:hypothetical protein
MDEREVFTDPSPDDLALDALLTERITRLGDGLPAPAVDPSILAASFDRRRRDRRRQVVLGRAAAVVAFLVLASGVTVALWPRDPGGEVHTTPFGSEPGTTAPLADTFGYGPGWHELDPGPFDPRSGASVVWTGTEVVVQGGAFAEDGGRVVERPATGVAYNLATRTNRTIAPGPTGSSGVGVWTGREIVYATPGPSGTIGVTPGGAAYDPATDAWRTISPPPVSTIELTGLGGSFWTGTEILFPRYLSAYNPTADAWRAMAAPPGELAGQIMTSVWSGRELVSATWWDTAVAYDPATDAWRSLPPAPKAGIAGPTMAATRYGGGLVFVDWEGQAKAFDTATEQWRSLSLPMTQPVKCNTRAVTLGDAAVIDICSQLLLLDRDDHFTPIERPLDARTFMATLVPAAGGIVAWSSNDDTLNDKEAPYTSFQLWVPPNDMAPRTTVDSTTPPAPSSAPAAPATPTGSWLELDPGLLSDRDNAVSVWTGTELIVWGGTTGGSSSSTGLADGAAYNPSTQTWRSIPDAPISGTHPIAVWDHRRMLVWEKSETGESPAAAFDPSTDTWTSLAPAPPRAAVAPSGAFWGDAAAVLLDLGVSYNPDLNEYRDLPMSRVKYGVSVWTGKEVIALGTTADQPSVNPVIVDRLTYAAGQWAEAAAPAGINAQSLDAAWTGTRVVVATYDLHAAAFDPASGAWSALPDLPLRSGECGVQLDAALDLAVASACGATAVLDTANRWTPTTSNRSPLPGTTVTMDGGLLRWASTAATDNGSSPASSLQRFLFPATDSTGRLEPVAAVLVGLLSFDVPEQSVIEASRQVTNQGLVDSVIVDVTPPSGDACRITATYYGVGAPFVLDEWRTKAKTPGDTVAGAGGATMPGFVLLAGELDDHGHVIIEAGTSDLVDVSCAALADAHDLAARLYPRR